MSRPRITLARPTLPLPPWSTPFQAQGRPNRQNRIVRCDKNTPRRSWRYGLTVFPTNARLCVGFPTMQASFAAAWLEWI